MPVLTVKGGGMTPNETILKQEKGRGKGRIGAPPMGWGEEGADVLTERGTARHNGLHKEWGTTVIQAPPAPEGERKKGARVWEEEREGAGVLTERGTARHNGLLKAWGTNSYSGPRPPKGRGRRGEGYGRRRRRGQACLPSGEPLGTMACLRHGARTVTFIFHFSLLHFSLLHFSLLHFSLFVPRRGDYRGPYPSLLSILKSLSLRRTLASTRKDTLLPWRAT